MLGVGGVTAAVSGPLAPPPGQGAARDRVPALPAGPGLAQLAGLQRRLAPVGGVVEPGSPQERGLVSVNRGRSQHVELLQLEPQPTNRNKREKQRGRKKRGEERALECSHVWRVKSYDVLLAKRR